MSERATYFWQWMFGLELMLLQAINIAGMYLLWSSLQVQPASWRAIGVGWALIAFAWIGFIASLWWSVQVDVWAPLERSRE